MKAYIQSIKPAALSAEFMALEAATDSLLASGADKNLDLVQAMATPYLKGFGIIAGAAMLEKAAQIPSGNAEFDDDKNKTAAFFKSNILPLAKAHLSVATDGSKDI